MIRRRSIVLSLVPFALAALVACGDDDPTEPTTTYDLTFSGDATFHDAHGGQDIHVFIEDSGGSVVATDEGTVSETQEPSFSFTFPDALEDGESYVLKYWIDSNFGGGTEGECDAHEVDHQWRIDLGTVDADVNLEDTHRPGETEQICSETDDNPGEPGY